MEERIELAEPELVAMGPREHREAVDLLAALIRAARSPLPARAPRRRTGPLERAAAGLPMTGDGTGNRGAPKAPGGTR